MTAFFFLCLSIEGEGQNILHQNVEFSGVYYCTKSERNQLRKVQMKAKIESIFL